MSRLEKLNSLKKITLDDINNVIEALPENAAEHFDFTDSLLKSEQPSIYDFIHNDTGLNKHEVELLFHITHIAWFSIRNVLGRTMLISDDYLYEQYDRNFVNYQDDIFQSSKSDSEINDSLSYPNCQPELISYLVFLISNRLAAPRCRVRQSRVPEIIINAKTVVDCLVIDEEKALAETCDRKYSDKNYKFVKKTGDVYADEFTKTSFYMKLKHAEKDNTESIITAFCEMMYNFFLMLPENWNARRAIECLTEIMPAKVMADDTYFEAIEPVMIAFMKFCAEKGYAVDAEYISRRLEGITPRVMQKAGDEGHWGIGKSFLKKAESSGVDPADKKQLDSFMKEYNKDRISQFGPSTDADTDKPGRNDPCPCGSGRKYKKCCGAEK